MRPSFGRGSGLTSDLTRDSATEAIRHAQRIFICYAHADLRVARWIRSRVVRLRRPRPPESVFLDQDSLVPGTVVTPDVIDAALSGSDLMLLLCGSATASRQEVRRELKIALELYRIGRLRLIPIMIKPHVPLPAGVDYTIQGIFLNRLFPERTYAQAAIVSLLLMLALSLSVGTYWGLPRWKYERAVAALKQYGAEVNQVDDGLKVVFFAGTQFKDAAVNELAGLQNLREVDLSESTVTDDGLQGLRSLSSVRILNLAETSITDAGWKHLVAMSGLRSLTVSDCHRLTPLGFMQLGSLTNLTTLIADDTAFSDDDVQIVASLPALVVLSLERTELTDTGLAELTSAKKLQQIFLDGTGVTDAGLVRLSSLSALRVLSLSRTKVQGPGLSRLVTLPNLRELRLRGAPLQESVGTHLLQLPNLRDLDLSETPVSEATVRDISRIKALTALYLIDVRGVTDKSVVALRSLGQLRELYIGGTAVGDVGLAVLAKMPSLRTLWVIANPITDAGLDAILAAGTQLRELNVNDTAVTDAAMAKANKAGTLRVIKQQPG
jgi:Leucine-rich repeat (LRR) protein